MVEPTYDPVRPATLDMYDPRYTIPEEQLFTVIGAEERGRLTVYCDVDIVARWLTEHATDGSGGYTVEEQHDVPDGGIGVVATVPLGGLTLHSKPRSRNVWRDVVGISVE